MLSPPSSSGSFNIPPVVRGALLALFATFSIWIHYQVKFGPHAQSMASRLQLGNVKVRQPAPDFTATDLEEQQLNLKLLSAQHIVVLDFWATWCPPCRHELPALQALHDEYQAQGVEILMVNLQEPRPQIREFMQRRQYKMRVIPDEDGAIARLYGVRAIPTTVVVDKHGIVRWIGSGISYHTEEFKSLMTELLNGS